MSIVQNIRSFYYGRALRSRLEEGGKRSTKHRQINLATAKRVAIFFDATEMTAREEVLRFAKRLRAENKRVRLLGYFRADVGEADYPFPYFTKKQVKWAGYPTGIKLDHFLEREYDLLFVPEARTNKVAEFIAKLTNAGMKIGPISESPDTYDLMLDAPRGANNKNFIDQVEKILEKTNAQAVAAV